MIADLGKEKASTTKDTRSTSLSQAQCRLGQAAEHEGHKPLPLINTDYTDLKESAEEPNLTTEGWRREETPNNGRNSAANEREERRIAFVEVVRGFADNRGWAHAPPELLRAA